MQREKPLVVARGEGAFRVSAMVEELCKRILECDAPFEIMPKRFLGEDAFRFGAGFCQRDNRVASNCYAAAITNDNERLGAARGDSTAEPVSDDPTRLSPLRWLRLRIVISVSVGIPRLSIGSQKGCVVGKRGECL